MPTTDQQPIAKAWAIVKQLGGGVPEMSSIEARSLLAEYARLEQSMSADSESTLRLRSAALSVATKMAVTYADFRFVPFLKMWDLNRMCHQDFEVEKGADGKIFPSLVDKVAKAYAYSLMFRPEETLPIDQAKIIEPFMKKIGCVLNNGNPCRTLLATGIRTVDARGRKMTFVQLITPKGTILSTEVHVLTQYQPLRYHQIPGMLFNALIRISKSGSPHIDAAVPATDNAVESAFDTCVGYVESLDSGHDHIHIYDSYSRHLVAEHSAIKPAAGQFVRFIPIIPQDSKFKTAWITSILPSEIGPTEFGLRRVIVSQVNHEQGYCAWTLAPGQPLIVEMGTAEPVFNHGFVNATTLNQLGITHPQPGDQWEIVVYLKRGKDKQKRPHIVAIRPCE